MKEEFLNQSTLGQNSWWRYILTMLTAFGFLIIGVIVPMFLINKTFKDDIPEYLSLASTLLPWALSICGLALGIRCFHKRPLITFFTIKKKLRLKKIVYAAGIWFLFTVIQALISFANNPDSIEFTFNINIFIPALFVCIILVPLQVSAEELIYRGYLLQGFHNIINNRWFPLICTSLLFMISHASFFAEDGNFNSLYLPLYYFCFACAMGIITLITNSLEVAIGVHFSNNIFGLLVVSSPNPLFLSPSIFTTIENLSEIKSFDFLVWCLLIIIFIYIAYRKWRD